MPDEAPVLLAMDGSIATITLNGPDLNAIDERTISTFTELLESVKRSPGVRALVIRSSSSKSFAVGADIHAYASARSATGERDIRRGQEWLNLIEDSPLPSIAVVDGWALGGGCELAMACTFRLTTARAKFALPETSLGAMPGYGGTFRLSRLIGEGRAMQMILLGEVVDGDAAKHMGLANWVVQPEDIDDELERICRDLISRAPIATSLAKHAVQQGRLRDRDAALDLEKSLGVQLISTEDQAEGIAAFLEKRSPEWRGV